jgi:hypothetical protein
MTKLTITGKRELDIAVAEHVMGATVYQVLAEGQTWRKYPDGTVLADREWNPTEDMNQAICFVLPEFFCGYVIDVLLPRPPNEVFNVMIRSDEYEDIVVQHTSLQIAICLAALKAKGFDVEYVGAVED